MQLSLFTRELHPRRAFRIARARKNAVRNVFVRLERDGICGYGEASPNAFYNETAEGVVAKLEGIRDALRSLEIATTEDISRAWERLWPMLAPSRAAQCAIDLALWDWLGKREGRSVCELAWGATPKTVTSFATIGLSTPEELVEKIEELRGFPHIKLKSDSSADRTPTALIRSRTSALLAVDANCAWLTQDLEHLTRELKDLGVTFVEQPFPPENNGQLRLKPLHLPVIADESCVTEDDVPLVTSCFDGFNIKLVKCGGITPALRMVRKGLAAGRSLMTGCMLESSLLIAAGAVVAQRTDYADLDGAWLLGDDPCEGWRFEKGILHPPEGSGLGAIVPDDFS